MAVIWFVLGDENDVRFWDFREMLNARWICMSGEEEFRMPHCTGAGQPWID